MAFRPVNLISMRITSTDVGANWSAMQTVSPFSGCVGDAWRQSSSTQTLSSFFPCLGSTKLPKYNVTLLYLVARWTRAAPMAVTMCADVMQFQYWSMVCFGSLWARDLDLSVLSLTCDLSWSRRNILNQVLRFCSHPWRIIIIIK